MIFDCDGTILDSMPRLTNIAVETISSVYKFTEGQAREAYEATIGIPFRAQLETIFPKHKHNNLAEEIYEKRHSYHGPEFSLSPGTEALCKNLTILGYLRAVVTSTDWIILRDRYPQVINLGWDFMSGYLPGNDKKTQIAKAMKALEIDPHRTLYVGDTNFDEECAKENGTEFLKIASWTLYDKMAERLWPQQVSSVLGAK